MDNKIINDIDNGSCEALMQDVATQNADREKWEREEAEKSKPPVVPLGFLDNGKTAAYYVRDRRKVVELKPNEHRGDFFITMADDFEWARWLHPDKNEDWVREHDYEIWRDARKRLMAETRAAGCYDANRERRIGLWVEVIDGEKGILCNSGEALHFMPAAGGALREVGGVHGRRFYTIDKPLPPPAADMATDDEGSVIVRGFCSLSWAFAGAGEIAAGWMACSLLAGLLPVRPSVWLTGAKGAGKTRVFKIISRFLGWIGTEGKEDEVWENWESVTEREGFGLMLESLDTSSPGLRQSLNSTLRPILFDEVEGNGEKENEATLRRILAVIRSAATSATGVITKGGKDGKSVEYKVRSSFLLSSIQARLDNAADRSRIVELPICEAPTKQGKAIAEKQAALEDLANDPDFCGRLLHRVMKLAPVFTKNRAILRAYLVDKLGDYRKADIFAPMLAGAHLLKSAGLMDEADMQHALGVVRSYDKTQDEADDGEQCLAVLLNAIVYQGIYGKMTVRQACAALANPATETEKRHALEQALDVYGMRWLMQQEILEVVTALGSNPNLKEIYSKSRWPDGQISAIICPGRKPTPDGVTRSTRKLGVGKTVATLRIPAPVIIPPADGDE